MQLLEQRAATSLRSDSATRLAATAVFSTAVTFTSGPRDFKNSAHWLMACSWEKIYLMSESLVPRLARRLWSIFRRTERTMEKLWWIMRS